MQYFFYLQWFWRLIKLCSPCRFRKKLMRILEMMMETFFLRKPSLVSICLKHIFLLLKWFFDHGLMLLSTQLQMPHLIYLNLNFIPFRFFRKFLYTGRKLSKIFYFVLFWGEQSEYWHNVYHWMRSIYNCIIYFRARKININI